ncbi:MAG: hypothetical protein ACLGH0_11110 [Thermoanaerobaculia bacterium]
MSTTRKAAKAKRTAKPKKKAERVILFPTEPTSIPKERITEAIRAVIAARK